MNAAVRTALHFKGKKLWERNSGKPQGIAGDGSHEPGQITRRGGIGGEELPPRAASWGLQGEFQERKRSRQGIGWLHPSGGPVQSEGMSPLAQNYQEFQDGSSRAFFFH